jgi:hypothetical protein
VNGLFTSKNGAGKEARTLDLYLGKVSLYQLSYSRMFTTEGVKEKTCRRQRAFNLVAWGGIEPPTQGFSMPILVLMMGASTRNFQSNQILVRIVAQKNPVKRIHAQSISITSVRDCVRR